MSRVLTGFFILALGAIAAARPAEMHPQQLVYQSQGSLANGTRVGFFLPAVAVALGLQSKSGPRVMTIGDLLICKPFDEATEVLRKMADGQMETLTVHQQLLNCGPLSPGGEDRVLAIVGIQWR